MSSIVFQYDVCCAFNTCEDVTTWSCCGSVPCVTYHIVSNIGPLKNNFSAERRFLLEQPKICNDQGALQLEGRLARVLERNSTFERLRTEQHAAFVSRCTGIDWTWNLWAPRYQQIQVPPGCLFVSLRHLVPVGISLVSPLFA